MVPASVLSLVLLVFCLVDVLRTPSTMVRTLPKPLWLLVALAPLFGPAAWFLAGRPARGAAAPAAPARLAPDDDEDFLRELRRRARDPRDD